MSSGDEPMGKGTMTLILCLCLCCLCCTSIAGLYLAPPLLDPSNSPLTPFDSTLDPDNLPQKKTTKWLLGIPSIVLFAGCLFFIGGEGLKYIIGDGSFGLTSIIDIAFKSIAPLIIWPVTVNLAPSVCCFCIWSLVMKFHFYNCSKAPTNIKQKCEDKVKTKNVWIKSGMSAAFMSYAIHAGCGLIVATLLYEIFIKNFTPVGKTLNSINRVQDLAKINQGMKSTSY